MKNKISIIGAGFVGSATAQRILEEELSDIVLVDILEGLAEAKALDLWHSIPIKNISTNIIGTTDYKEIRDSSVIIITAGLPRQHGMNREDLICNNGRIVNEVVENVKRYAPDAIIIVVTNPLDVMSFFTYKISGLPSNKVIGMGGVLDTSRYKTLLAKELRVSPIDVHAMVIGCHGNDMMPLIDYTTVSGIPVKSLLSTETLLKIVSRTKTCGGEIVNLLKTGSAHYAPAAAIVDMVESIIRDEKRLLPASVLLNGEYGIYDAYIGVPIVIGSKGVEKIIELKLRDEELAQLNESADEMKKHVEKLEYNLEAVKC